MNKTNSPWLRPSCLPPRPRGGRGRGRFAEVVKLGRGKTTGEVCPSCAQPAGAGAGAGAARGGEAGAGGSGRGGAGAGVGAGPCPPRHGATRRAAPPAALPAR